MIDTVSDLLLQLKEREQALLKKYDIIKHPGIIGSMYKKLTKELVNKTVFKGLDLRVCAGKIVNTVTKELSAEIDCMIVVGDGDNIPFTDKFIYDSKRVVAVIQVKKNLFSKDIKDSFENLRSVIKVSEFHDGSTYHMRLLRGAYRLLCREELPKRAELENIPINRQMIYHTLLLDAFHPIRIVWGYNGFKSELSLRESFFKYLEANLSDSTARKKGYGPLNFPNLVICDKYSLVKANGMPFVYPLVRDEWWPFYTSTNENPLYFLLEILWTRLDHMFNISSTIYGDDLKMEQMHGYLLCKYGQHKDLTGWQYFYVEASKQILEKPLEHKDWEPVFLKLPVYVVINRLCIEDVDTNNDTGFNEFIIKHGYKLDDFLTEIKETGLVSIYRGVLHLITEQCLCGVSNDGRFFAGENSSGRVTRWLNKLIDKKSGQ